MSRCASRLGGAGTRPVARKRATWPGNQGRPCAPRPIMTPRAARGGQPGRRIARIGKIAIGKTGRRTASVTARMAPQSACPFIELAARAAMNRHRDRPAFPPVAPARAQWARRLPSPAGLDRDGQAHGCAHRVQNMRPARGMSRNSAAPAAPVVTRFGAAHIDVDDVPPPPPRPCVRPRPSNEDRLPASCTALKRRSGTLARRVISAWRTARLRSPPFRTRRGPHHGARPCAAPGRP